MTFRMNKKDTSTLANGTFIANKPLFVVNYNFSNNVVYFLF